MRLGLHAALSPQDLAPLLAGGVTFCFALGVDLGSKALAVAASPGIIVVYDHRHVGDWRSRVALSLAALAAVGAGSLVARWRGIGRLWGAWIGVGLLVAGITGNGLSHLLWTRGTPDFIWVPGRYVWNVADFAIGIGLTGAVASVAVAAAAAAWRDRGRAQRGSGSSSHQAASQNASS